MIPRSPGGILTMIPRSPVLISKAPLGFKEGPVEESQPYAPSEPETLNPKTFTPKPEHPKCLEERFVRPVAKSQAAAARMCSRLEAQIRNPKLQGKGVP